MVFLRAMTLMAALLLAGASAPALTLAETNPLFFPMGGANTGFDAGAVAASGEPISWEATPATPILCAGAGAFEDSGVCEGLSGYQLTVVSEELQRPIDENPQAMGTAPSAANPLIATSLWTVTNTSEVAFDDPLVLVFNSVDLTGNPFVDPYPDLEIGLDANEFGLVRYTASGSESFFGGAAMGALGPGESASFLVRYVINDPLPLVPDLVPPEGPDLVLPRLLVFGIVVPEPGTAALLATGLAALAARRRGRRCA